MAQVKFISGDGVEHEVEETSMAAEIMRQNGFQQIGVLATEGTESTEIDLSKLNRDALIAEAAKLGITIDAEDKAQTKALIIGAIEAKQAEPAGDVVYTEEDAIGQNNGLDESTAAGGGASESSSDAGKA